MNWVTDEHFVQQNIELKLKSMQLSKMSQTQISNKNLIFANWYSFIYSTYFNDSQYYYFICFCSEFSFLYTFNY